MNDFPPAVARFVNNPSPFALLLLWGLAAGVILVSVPAAVVGLLQE